jgi:hypothetical protein
MIIDLDSWEAGYADGKLGCRLSAQPVKHCAIMPNVDRVVSRPVHTRPLAEGQAGAPFRASA